MYIAFMYIVISVIALQRIEMVIITKAEIMHQL